MINTLIVLSLVATDVWMEAYKSLGNLILKFNNWNSGNGFLFTNDSLYTYQDGTLQSTKYRIHDLVVTQMNFYMQSSNQS